MKSVTRNGRSILLTAVFAIILVYLFSIIGFIFFKEDFVLDADALEGTEIAAAVTVEAGQQYCTDPANETSCQDGRGESAFVEALKDAREEASNNKERSCDSLLMCIVTTLNHGLRNGGGIGDVLRPPSNTEALFPARVIYDMLFFFIVIIIVLNLIFGVIIDTFADLRSEKQQKEEIIKNSCFICGKKRPTIMYFETDLT